MILKCLILKQKLIRLYSCFVSSYFHKKRRKLSRSILSEEQNCALISLKKDFDIGFTKPDKGNGVVILNRNDYVDKMHKILDNRTKFMTCNQDTNLSNLTKFQRSLYYLNSKKHCAVKSTLEYIPLLQPLLLYTDYQNYTNLKFPLDQFFPLVGSLIMNVPVGYRNLSQTSDNIPPTFQTPSPFFPKFPIIILATKPWCHLMSKAFLSTFLSHLL